METANDLFTEASSREPNLQVFPLIFFFTLSFLLNWALILLYQHYPFEPLQLLMAWAPNISAVVTIGFVLKEENGIHKLLKGWKKWKLSPFWYLVGFSPLIMVLITIIIYLLLGGTLSFSETPINWGFIFFMVIIVLFTGATGEELGWRGFLQPQLQTRFNWLISSIIVGLCWGLWHLPLWLTGIWIETNLGLYLIDTIALSIIIGWAFNKTNQSVFIASMFHYFVNIPVLLFSSGGLGLITTEVYGTLSSIIYSLCAIAVVIFFGITNRRSSEEPLTLNL